MTFSYQMPMVFAHVFVWMYCVFKYHVDNYNVIALFELHNVNPDIWKMWLRISKNFTLIAGVYNN